jgi:hypothetical protein
MNLSPEQRAIALFWSDDPGITCTPPGHSVSILTQVTRDGGYSLDVAAEAYAQGRDRRLRCLHCLLEHEVPVQPASTRYVHPSADRSDVELPARNAPVPGVTSGHSVPSGASAQVLTDLFGPLAFTDHTHDDRGLPPRSFSSFFQLVLRGGRGGRTLTALRGYPFQDGHRAGNRAGPVHRARGKQPPVPSP